MSDIHGSTKRLAPHTVDTQAGAGTVEIVGTPCYISIKAEGGDAEVIFTNVDPGTAIAGDGWIVTSGETVDWLVQSSRRYLQVISGTVRFAKSG